MSGVTASLTGPLRLCSPSADLANADRKLESVVRPRRPSAKCAVGYLDLTPGLASRGAPAPEGWLRIKTNVSLAAFRGVESRPSMLEKKGVLP